MNKHMLFYCKIRKLSIQYLKAYQILSLCYSEVSFNKSSNSFNLKFERKIREIKTFEFELFSK